MNNKKFGIYLILLTICLTLLTTSIIYTGLKINELTDTLKDYGIIRLEKR